ncbi:high mobility group box domain-containing protein, partial [Trametes elegans]
MPPTRKTRKRTPTNSPLADRTKKEVGRPPNAWILYRLDHLPQISETYSTKDHPIRQAEASRIIARQWRAESPEVRQQYEKKAEIAKAEHNKAHPDWKYRP